MASPQGDVVALDREGSLWLPGDEGWLLAGEPDCVPWTWQLLVEAWGPMRVYSFVTEVARYG